MVQAVAQSMLRMRGAEAAIEQAWAHCGQHIFKNEAALVRLLEEAKAAGLDGRTSPIIDLVQKRITMVCVCVCVCVRQQLIFLCVSVVATLM